MELRQTDRGGHVDRKRLSLPILFESDHEIVVVKPAGMASELTSDPKGVSLLSRLRMAAPNITPKLPHRLDRVTRGIVVAALSDEAIRFHNACIREGDWVKLYLARVRCRQGQGFEGLLGVHRLHLRIEDRRAVVVRSGGKRAITEVLAIDPAPERHDEAHVLLRLHTGRYHQIRATMAALDMPLVDDWVYDSGARREDRQFYLEHVALRFVPFQGEREQTVHLRDDPGRERIDKAMRRAIDRALEQWEENDAEEH